MIKSCEIVRNLVRGGLGVDYVSSNLKHTGPEVTFLIAKIFIYEHHINAQFISSSLASCDQFWYTNWRWRICRKCGISRKQHPTGNTWRNWEHHRTHAIIFTKIQILCARPKSGIGRNGPLILQWHRPVFIFPMFRHLLVRRPEHLFSGCGENT